MGNFDKKLERFWEVFIEHNGYVKVLTGLQNTVWIAVAGLAIGILIGTMIAVVRVMPKTNRLARFLDGLCVFYVALFRGTPIVVQLLVAYYVALPLIGVNIPALQVCVIVFGLNSAAYVSEIMRAASCRSIPARWRRAGRSA